jgi:regulator of sirC expression with transglutaminase-like and TPR domain
MDGAARFAGFVAGDQPIAVDEGALLIAAHLDPGIEVARERRRLDHLADSVREPTLDGVRRRLFDDLGFVGDRATYYDPRNSMLPSVLDRRKGIPISLAVLTMAVAARVSVPLDGVGMPGHFLLRDRVDDQVFIDPFDRGLELDRAGCEARFRQIQGPEAPFDPGWLEPTPARGILARMLANLRAVYGRTGDRGGLLGVLELVTALPESGDEDARMLASALAARGRFDEAASVHERLAGDGADGDDRAQATSLRARLN